MAVTVSKRANQSVAQAASAAQAFDIDTFLFDVDGVLADTAELHAAAWREAAEEIGIEIPASVIPLLRGRSREDSLRLILGERELSAADFARVMDRKNGHYVSRLEGLTSANALPGAGELLSDLSRGGFRLAAVSASRNARTVLTRTGLVHRFERVVDGLVSLPRGQTNRYAYAAVAMRCDPARCVVVEDSQTGVELARFAGMKVIGLGQAVRDSEADMKLDSLRAVRAKDLLAAIRGGAGPKS